eukprot:6201856-Pleurochrysis_carterae.AAC.1
MKGADSSKALHPTLSSGGRAGSPQAAKRSTACTATQQRHRPAGRALAQLVTVYPRLSKRGQCYRGIRGRFLEIPQRRQEGY